MAEDFKREDIGQIWMQKGMREIGQGNGERRCTHRVGSNQAAETCPACLACLWTMKCGRIGGMCSVNELGIKLCGIWVAWAFWDDFSLVVGQHVQTESIKPQLSGSQCWRPLASLKMDVGLPAPAQGYYLGPLARNVRSGRDICRRHGV